ncbi:MAG: sulfite exporter TauE/SafE family protein [Bacteroidetes bacterium]|nr:sulfite exporter TauE/SafE family protein [Bacteroidota bacterium]
MELWTAFTIGLLGSLHCVGMCGAIAFALPRNKDRWRFLSGRILYNLGRVATYSILGIFFGFVGQAVSLAGFQQRLSITIGILMLLAILIPNKFTGKLLSVRWIAPFISRIKSNIGKLFGHGSMPALFAIGLLNGLLPCGFVYVGIGGSLTTNSIGGGAAYMALFGLGTLPTMLAASLATNVISINVRNAVRRFLPVAMAVLAVMFIMRGMALGIPYLSPKLSSTPTIPAECHQ